MTTSISSLLLRCWPGFQKLWFRGDLHSLLVSILFAWTLMLAWAASFLWPEWLSDFAVNSLLSKIILFVLWFWLAAACVIALVQVASPSDRGKQKSDAERARNLELAQEYYLRADYFEAERLVKKNCTRDFVDLESSLLWVTILRRTRRLQQALEQIEILERLEAALPWATEIRFEKEACLHLKVQTPPAHDRQNR